MANQLNTGFLKIDLSREIYKSLHSVLFIFRIGVWRPLPTILSIAVVKIKLKHIGTSRSNSQTAHLESTFCVFMRAKSANIRVYTNDNLIKVLENAKEISGFLNIPLVNYCLN
jgi:hypothetical protein